jgi:molecular chaperone HscB
MIQCPSCGRRQEPRLTCEQCGAPLGADLDCFAALGLPRRLVIDAAALERAYHELSRRIHPDRFAQAPARVRDASLRSTALLTRGYRTLRDPVARGLYWLELRGEKLADNNKSVPPDLAELVFEVQDELARMRDASGAEAAAIRERALARKAELEAAMGALQDELAAGGDAAALLPDLKQTLSRIAYMRTLIRDVDREIGNLKAA